jgi:hypothetical protein
MLGSYQELSNFVGRKLNKQLIPVDNNGNYPDYSESLEWAMFLINIMQDNDYECEIKFALCGLNKAKNVYVVFTKYQETKRYCGVNGNMPKAVLLAAVEALEDV